MRTLHDRIEVLHENPFVLHACLHVRLAMMKTLRKKLSHIPGTYMYKYIPKVGVLGLRWLVVVGGGQYFPYWLSRSALLP